MVAKPSKYKLEKFNEMTMKKFKDSGIPMYKGPIIEKMDGSPSGFILHAGEDDLGFYCIVQCSCCEYMEICRKCPGKDSRLNCVDEHLALAKNNPVHEQKNYDEANPDFDDPFAPDSSSERIVVCIHCGEEYKEKEIRWSKTTDMWMCKNYPRCDGAGLGFDIHYKDL